MKFLFQYACYPRMFSCSCYLRGTAILLLVVLTAPVDIYAQHDKMLWYDSPAQEWTDAMPVGNGRLGAMVFGNPGHERIQLNEESLWAGSKINNNNPLARQHLPEIRQALFDGEYQCAWDLSDKYLLGTPPEIRSYQPLGDIDITYSWEGDPSGYKRELLLNTGVARTSYAFGKNNVMQEVYVSAPHDVIVISVEATDRFDMAIALSRGRDVDEYGETTGTAWFTGQIQDEDHPKKGPGGRHMRFSAGMRVLSTDGVVTPAVQDSATGFSIVNARKITLILTAATDYDLSRLDTNPALDPLSICQRLLSEASRRNPAQLRAAHEKDHRGYFDRVSFSLGGTDPEDLPTDQRLELVKQGKIDHGLIPLYYQYGRYLLMASSRKPGRLPANLQGIWNHLYTAKWNSDYHTNINIQMNYWPAETGNLPETAVVLADFVKQLVEPGSATAREMYGARGWTLHHLTDVYGRTGVADGVWGFSPMAGPWLTFQLYDHYLFTGDEHFLREVAYPVIAGSVRFVLDFLVESPEGYLVTNPSHSPENPFVVPGTDGKEKAYLSYAATIDVQIIHALFRNFMESATVLGVDRELVDSVMKVSQRLPPMRVGRNGTLQEWIHDYEEFEPGHRHISHLLGLYPLDLISERDPVLFEAAKKTIERRLSYSQRHVGWSSAWIINFFARLHDGEKAGEQVQRLLQHSTLGSLLNTIPPFQIDGNFGGAAGIAEMLLQSHNQTLHILPALPSNWPNGEIYGLRARGGYQVDMRWKAGQLNRLIIYADKAGEQLVRYGDALTTIKLRKGKNDLSKDRQLFGIAP